MNKIFKNFPPFCWTDKYKKFRITRTVIGKITEFVIANVMLFYGYFMWFIASLIGTYIMWAVMPKLIKYFRPCEDCQKNKKEVPVFLLNLKLGIR